MLQYDFMQKALLTAVLVSASIPLIGTVIVLRRLSSIGEALSHTSLAGVTVGLVCGLNPTVTAALLSIIASIIIELVRRKVPRYGEIAVNVVLSAGIGLTAILSGFTGNSANLNSYLFGSIVAVDDVDLWLTAGICGIVILASCILYRPLFSITFDEEHAKIFGLPIGTINLLFSVITALAVSVTARTVGALIVSSFIVIPVACSMVVAKSYRKCMLWSVAFAVFFAVAGLVLAFYLDLKPGGTMALLGVATLLVMLPFSKK